LKRYTESEKLIIFLIIFVAGVLLAGLFSAIPFLISDAKISDLSNSEGLQELSSGFLRLQLFLNHLGMFLLPSFIYGIYVYGKSGFAMGFNLDRSPKSINFILAVLFFLAAYPLVNFIHYINTLIPLAEWMEGTEQNVRETLNKILSSDNKFMLVLNILLISIMPAIGEEFIFRGILQKLISKIFKNGHLGVWIAAFLFSAIHLQFEGFLARMVLGAILGYTFYFTRNLWIPMFLHFLNNLIPLLSFMLMDKDLTDTANFEQGLNWYSLIVPLIGIPIVVYFFLRYNKSPDHSYA